MRTLHLFAGAGGGLLADLILGHEPVCAVEWDAYCCEVLRERRDDGWFPGLEVYEGDVREFDPRKWKGQVDCVAAGWPCNGVSVAGPRTGMRHPDTGLWSEVSRVVEVVRPTWVFLENGPRLVHDGLKRVIGDLTELRYSVRWLRLSAGALGAPHARLRWWGLAQAADSDSNPVWNLCRWRSWAGGQDPAELIRNRTVLDWWSAEPAICGVDAGNPCWVDGHRALGGMQVPLQAAAAWVMLGGPVA